MEKILAVIIAVVAAVIVMVFFLVRRKSNRRLAEIKEAKDAFAKRVGIPQKYAKAYEGSCGKTEKGWRQSGLSQGKDVLSY